MRSVEQRVMRFGRGRSGLRLASCEDVWYVVSGQGVLRFGESGGGGGPAQALEPEMGVLLPPGTQWAVDNRGPHDLVIVSVQTPAVRRASRPGVAPAVVRLADQPAIPTGDREFRIVVDPAVGCEGVTQFVGWIPPGRAPVHTHPYEEVVYVLEGEGLLHVDGSTRPLRAGSSIHLPPSVPHCLENTGTTPLRVLGVFHPPGSPASMTEVRASLGSR